MDSLDMHQSPLNWTIGIWLMAVGMSVMGGFVNFYNKINYGKTRVFNLIELIGEMATSGFVGLGAFMLMNSYDQHIGVSAVVAGICGHMGTRLLFVVERVLENKLEAMKNK